MSLVDDMSLMLTIVAYTLGDSSPRDNGRIPSQPVPGTHPHPPLPPLRAQQLLSRPLQPFPVSAAALVALGLGQPTP
jgi:hypothetical protein